MAPTPPTGVPDLYRGNPPGSADNPSGERCGPTVVAEPLDLLMKSEQARELN